MVSSTVGSSTITCWKRRSSAASFSRYLRYSSSVVAPTQCSSPRASIGFSRLPASMEPSVFPAPTRSEEHTSELQSRFDLVCRLLLEKKKKTNNHTYLTHIASKDTST